MSLPQTVKGPPRNFQRPTLGYPAQLSELFDEHTSCFLGIQFHQQNHPLYTGTGIYISMYTKWSLITISRERVLTIRVVVAKEGGEGGTTTKMTMRKRDGGGSGKRCGVRQLLKPAHTSNLTATSSYPQPSLEFYHTE
ncbi:hypothetical protein EDD16DRAFT_1524568 [Pisolithus croceorrhizus]|nr:hypothetical protein EDD16DRAFT_1524568 [Pisolithus croceorrhizus]